MKAYVADRSGPGGVTLADLPSPVAGPGVAVVTVAATSLNRGEVQHVRSYGLIPEGGRTGWDLAGIVKEAATDGTGPAAGTRVFGWAQERGSWAEEVAVPVTDIAPMPAGLSFEDASTLGVAALTAHGAIACARRPLAGTSVLVTGSTGGVGLFALQLASLAGATTIASVQRESDGDLVRELVGAPVGVEVGIDPEGAPVELIVESVGGPLLSNALQRVARGGVVVTLGRTDPTDSVVPAGWFLKGSRLDGLTVGAAGGVAQALAEMGDHVVAGKLRTNVSRVLPAADLPAAMDALIDRQVRGKVVVTWDAG